MTRGVLFLCTGNACRSQMAEGIARSLLPSSVGVFSAGTNPKGLDPRSIDALHEIGIDISQYRSKGLEEIAAERIGLLVTLCGDAAEHCPTLPGVEREHWPIRDPARVQGSDAEIAAAFRVVRDELRQRVSVLVASFQAESEPTDSRLADDRLAEGHEAAR